MGAFLLRMFGPKNEPVSSGVHRIDAENRRIAAYEKRIRRMPQQVKILYDGQCSLCRQAIEGLTRHDAKGLITTEDISAPAFAPARYGLTAQQVRTVMHAVLPDGRVLRAMDAVRAVTRRGTRLARCADRLARHSLARRCLLPLFRTASNGFQPHVRPKVRFGKLLDSCPTAVR